MNGIVSAGCGQPVSLSDSQVQGFPFRLGVTLAVCAPVWDEVCSSSTPSDGWPTAGEDVRAVLNKHTTSAVVVAGLFPDNINYAPVFVVPLACTAGSQKQQKCFPIVRLQTPDHVKHWGRRGRLLVCSPSRTRFATSILMRDFQRRDGWRGSACSDGFACCMHCCRHTRARARAATSMSNGAISSACMHSAAHPGAAGIHLIHPGKLQSAHALPAVC